MDRSTLGASIHWARAATMQTEAADLPKVHTEENSFILVRIDPPRDERDGEQVEEEQGDSYCRDGADDASDLWE
jgi:hypothetical protein